MLADASRSIFLLQAPSGCLRYLNSSLIILTRRPSKRGLDGILDSSE